jgi:hypothetical protein
MTADTDPPKEAPIQERRFDETEVGAAKMATFTEITPVKDAAFASQADLLPAHLGLNLTSQAIADHRRLGQHLQSRQDGAAGGLEGYKNRQFVDAEENRGHTTAPQGPRGSRLRPIRPA